MTSLIGLEWRKVRKEPSLLFAFALHMVPTAMVIAAAVAGAVGGGEKRYFVIHNQSMLVTGLVGCIVTSIVFNVETANRTWFDWLTLPQGPVRLTVSKMITAAGILASFVAVSAGATLALLVGSGVSEGLLRMITGYLTLQTGTMAVMVPLSALVFVVSRSAVITNVAGLALSMATLVVMGAPFSWFIPTAWAYRAGLGFVSAEYAAEGASNFGIGTVAWAACAVTACGVALFAATRPGVINAPMR